MDYTVRKAEVDLIALEGHLASLAAVRDELKGRNVSQGMALECDALMHNCRGQGSLLSLHYNYGASSHDYQVALEGVFSTVWENIKIIFRKVIEYIKKFWLWITGKTNQVTTQKVEAAENSSDAFNDVWDKIFERLGEGASGKVTTYDGNGNGTTAEYKDGKRVEQPVTGKDDKWVDPGDGPVIHAANKAARVVKDAGAKVGEAATKVAHGARDAVRKGLDAVDSASAKVRGDDKPVTGDDIQDAVKKRREENANSDSPTLRAHSKPMKVDEMFNRREPKAKSDDSVPQLRNTEDLDEFMTGPGKTVEDATSAVDKRHAEAGQPAKEATARVGDHQLKMLEGFVNEAKQDVARAQGELDAAKKAGQTGEQLARLEARLKTYKELEDTHQESVDKFRKQVEEHASKTPATEGIAVEDAGIGHRRPVDILNETAEGMKSQFLSGIPRPESLILFSHEYGQGLEQLAHQFARLKPIKALAWRYKQLSELLPVYLAEAARIDAIKDETEHNEKYGDFQNRASKTLDYALDREDGKKDDADQLTEDVKRFHAAREDHGGEGFGIQTPANGDQLMHVASVTADVFRTVKSVIGQVQEAAAELKNLEQSFEALSSKIAGISSGGEGRHTARDWVAHCMSSEVRSVSSQVRTCVQGMAVFTNYYSDAHRAVSRYQKFVIKVVEAALKEMHGEHEFQEEQIKSALNHLRDAASSFQRLTA